MLKDERFITRFEAIREVIRRRQLPTFEGWVTRAEQLRGGNYRVKSVPGELIFDGVEDGPAMYTVLRGLKARGARKVSRG